MELAEIPNNDNKFLQGRELLEEARASRVLATSL